MANAMSLLGGGKPGFSNTQRAGMILGAMGGQDQEAYRKQRQQEMQQGIMQESYMALQQLDSNDSAGAQERIATLAEHLATQGVDNSNFLMLKETMATDPKAARKMILDAGKGAVASGQIDLKNNPMWAAVLGEKEKPTTIKGGDVRSMIDAEGNFYQVLSQLTPEGSVRNIDMSTGQPINKRLYGEKSKFYKDATAEAEEAKPVEALSPAGKLLVDLGFEPGTETFQAQLQVVSDSAAAPEAPSKRESLTGLSDFVASGEAFQSYTQTINQADRALNALSGSGEIPQKIALAQRTVSEIYNGDSKAASEIDRFVAARGFAQGWEDFFARLSGGVGGQTTLDALKDISQHAKTVAINDRYMDILNNLSYQDATFDEYRRTMRRFDLPVKMDEKTWDRMKNE